MEKQQAMKGLGAISASAVLAFGLAGCGVIDSVLGPTCGDFDDASATEKQEMVLDWMKDKGLAPEDAEMTSAGNSSLLLGFDVMGWVQAFEQECRVRDDGDRLSDFDPGF